MRHLVLLGLLASLLLSQAVEIDDLMAPFVQQMAETRARYSVVCGKFRGDEIMFTGKCALLKPNFLELLDRIPKEILEFDPEKNVDDLLRAFLPRMFVFFNDKYPKYRGNLTTFFGIMNELGNKMKTGTSNVDMIEVDAAFENSGLWKAKQELIDEKAVLVTATSNLSFEEQNAALANYKCDTDSLFCTYTDIVFGIVDTKNWNTLKISQVLSKGVNNSIEYLSDPFLIVEYERIYGLLGDLETKGTAEVKVSRIQSFLKETKYWRSIVKVFETENYAPPTDPTTTTKTTRTTTQREKVIPKVAVSSEWYITVPTVVFVLGIIIAVALFFTTQSNAASRNQVVANKPRESPPQRLQPAQLSKPAPAMPDYRQQQYQQQQQDEIEMKPRLTSAERSHLAGKNRPSERRQPPPYNENRQPGQASENEVQF